MSRASFTVVRLAARAHQDVRAPVTLSPLGLSKCESPLRLPRAHRARSPHCITNIARAGGTGEKSRIRSIARCGGSRSDVTIPASQSDDARTVLLEVYVSLNQANSAMRGAHALRKRCTRKPEPASRGNEAAYCSASNGCPHRGMMETVCLHHASIGDARIVARRPRTAPRRFNPRRAAAETPWCSWFPRARCASRPN
jgi:hypothetical protein